MFIEFFYLLRKEGIPVSLHEYLNLLEALSQEVIGYSVDDFYYLSKSLLVKHESHLDRFDKLFGHYFEGLDYIPEEQVFDISKEWLERSLENMLSDEDKAMIEAMGGLDKLMERFKELLKEQKERHEGGNKWIGTGGTSPFGNGGYNPEGIRIGGSGGNRKALKVWGNRDFANLDDRQELNTRNIKMALKRLRVFTREGMPDELDIDETIKRTSDNAGYLDIAMIPSKQNRVKVLLFLDAGGSMDDHVEICTRLFSAARHEFKHLEYFYFHNCIYETVWKDNRRRSDRIPTLEILHKYNKDYKVIIVGDAAMSPYEILSVGGSVEHHNDEAGIVWLSRMKDHFPYMTWVNPNPQYGWQYYESTIILRDFMEKRMFPMTVEGLAKCMQCLKNNKKVFEIQ